MSILMIIFKMLTSGAGGSILGGVLGLFKHSQERKERIEIARINMERDRLEYDNAEKEREHALTMLKKGAEHAIEEAQTEADAEIEIAHTAALSSAQEALENLKTSSRMDDFRGSVRPVLAYWGILLFSIILIWAFAKYRSTIDVETGKEILLSLISTLTFIVTSIVTFYYVARRNAAPKL